MHHHIQEHFPQLFPQDRRRLHVDQLVRILPEADTRLGGLWMVVKEIDPDYVTGVVCIEGEDPQMVRLPRGAVEDVERAVRKGHAKPE